MRIATYRHNNTRHVGRVSSDGLHVQAFEVSAAIAHHGALRLLETVVSGGQWPTVSNQQLAVRDVLLEAPIPVPRRNIWCVGRNYHEHAKELSTSVFKDSNTNTQAWQPHLDDGCQQVRRSNFHRVPRKVHYGRLQGKGRELCSRPFPEHAEPVPTPFGGLGGKGRSDARQESGSVR